MPTLNWMGKEAVRNHHHTVPFRLLRDVGERSVGDPGSGNLIVEGDNLVALKALLPYYAGQVKCIYIDPPYNTGNENWVYNDNVNSPLIREWLGKVVGKEAEDLSRHDKWLCMMYPRLALLKEFLRKDGIIMISIDDFEVFHLRSLMNEIFGGGNFIAQLIWDKTRKNDAKLFSAGHEYIVVYARSLATLRKLKTVWRESKPGADEIIAKYRDLRKLHTDDDTAIENELRTWYSSLPRKHPSKKLSRYRHVDKWGVWRDRDISWPGGGGPRYDVPHDITGLPCRVPERGWGFATFEEMKRQIDLGLVVFREDHTEPPIRKAHLVPVPEELDDTIDSFSDDEIDDETEEGPVGLQVMPSVIQKQAQVAVKLLRNMFGGKRVFENPKDHEVLMRLIKYVTKPGDLVLDAFAGSGSSGHAVLQLNNEGKGERRFILIEMDETIAREVTHERLAHVINGYSYSTRTGSKHIDGVKGGFRYCELGEPLFDAGGQIHESVSFSDLARHVYFTETGEPLPRDRVSKSPLLGVCRGVAVYLLFNGILGDKRSNGGNILTRPLLANLPEFDGPKVIYASGCFLSTEKLQAERITFRQTPYEIRIA